MQDVYGGQYASSIMLIRDLRSMMPNVRRRDHRPRAPSPVPSQSLNDLRHLIETSICQPSSGKKMSQFRAVEASLRGERFPKSVIGHKLIPGKHHTIVDKYKNCVYGSKFVCDGELFVTSSQDMCIRVYDTKMSEDAGVWEEVAKIDAQGVRWTITDCDVSPDGRWLAYSSINSYVHLVDLHNLGLQQKVLDFSVFKQGMMGTCIWSLVWSYDGTELIAGTRDSKRRGNVVVYDVQLKRIVEVISAHDEDVNSVCFMQTGDCNLILSGSDDALVKMWDRRDMTCRRLGETHRPCGLFVGHQFGLTCVSTKDDGRYLLSNSKDQYIKLWDARRCTSMSDIPSIKMPPRDRSFDYRVQACPLMAGGSRSFRDDSVMTYGGDHETLQTLIRAYFSPLKTTGQKYVYCGSSDGRCVIYDVLTGKAVASLAEHRLPVRDVSWHPTACCLATSSWDGQVLLWSTSEIGSLADGSYELPACKWFED